MTRQQVNLISEMIRSQTTAAFHDARRELLESCEEQQSDAAAPQPSVTVTATSSQSEPVQPSNPQPVGFDYKRSLLEGEKKTTLSMYMGAVENANKLQAEVKSLKEVIGSQDGKIASLKESVENRTKTIEMLKNQIELLVKRIKDDREHRDDCREHNNELVAANAEIHQSLRHWGLEQSEPCSLVNNVKQVIQLCAERGKKIEDLNGNVNALQLNINAINESHISAMGNMRKRIAELEKHAASRQVIIDQLNADLASANTDIGNLNRELAEKDVRAMRMSDNIAKLRHEKDSDEASYIKQLSERALRIAALKQSGTNLHACLKRYHYSDTQQPHVVSALRNWEKEAR